MGIVQKMNRITHANQPMLVLMLRVALGLLLLFKGISFLSNAEELEAMISQSRFSTGTAFLITYITFAHLFGGTFIVIGLLTRWVVLLQIPILIGAVLFVNRGDLFSMGSEFALSLIVLLLLVFFLFEGGGAISMDRYLKKYLL